MLLAALRWHRCDCAFKKFQEGVLDALPQIFVARATPLDLVDLVNENDALLGNISIAVG